MNSIGPLQHPRLHEASHLLGGADAIIGGQIGPNNGYVLTDVTSPAAPGAGKVLLYSTAGVPMIRAGAAGAETEVSLSGHGASHHVNRTRYFFISHNRLYRTIAGSFITVTDSQTRYEGAAFDAATDNRVGFDFAVPADWASGNLVATICFYLASNNTSKGIVWAWVAGPMTTPGTTSILNFTIAATETETITANAEIYQEYTSSQVFTPTAAGQIWRFNFGRVGNDAADTVSGNVVVIGIRFSYTADM